tara:strand:+ start:352 stop:516 length:165 start_codon:yes stop_codon:yes gene_type:complete
MPNGYTHYHFKLTRRESMALQKFLLNEKLDHFDKQALPRVVDKILNGELREIPK